MSMWNVANCSSKKLDWQFWQISCNTYSSCHPCVSFVSNIIDKCQKFDRQQRATISIQFMVFFSVIKVYERQQILENSIGALPEEHEAYNTLLILTATCVPGLFIATVLQFLSYYCFNRFFHPFKDILSGPKSGKDISTKFELILFPFILYCSSNRDARTLKFQNLSIILNSMESQLSDF